MLVVNARVKVWAGVEKWDESNRNKKRLALGHSRIAREGYSDYFTRCLLCAALYSDLHLSYIALGESALRRHVTLQHHKHSRRPKAPEHAISVQARQRHDADFTNLTNH